MKIAILGATGAVGREMLEDLQDSNIKDVEVGFFASARSEGQTVEFRGVRHTVKAFAVEKLKGYDYALMSAGGSFSKENSPKLAEIGVTVIDNSSAWRQDPAVALVVPEVNASVLDSYKGRIIANPNCSTIQMVVCLAPLQKAFGLDMVQVSTYQSVSGTGQKGISELADQVSSHLRFQDPVPKVYAQPIIFNLLPGIGPIDASGHCEEEVKMVLETRKILGIPNLDVLASTIRVPVFSCHSETLAVRLTKEVSRQELQSVFKDAKGIEFYVGDEYSSMPTPRLVAGKKDTFVSRVRLPYGQDRSRWVQFWNVADNLKKGAATNAVQILEYLVAKRK
ncbi:MAG: aspartate-semialdehyde dehydrogenase [Pseudomonadota bacterium]